METFDMGWDFYNNFSNGNILLYFLPWNVTNVTTAGMKYESLLANGQSREIVNNFIIPSWH